MKQSIKIAWLYPDLMSTYGDRGNVIVFTKRCQWRDIGVEIVPVTLETNIAKLKACDLLFMGGAQDRQQKLAGEDFLMRKGPVVKDMVDAGVPALFVCAAYQFMGHYYRPYKGDDIPGAGIFDLVTIHPGDQEQRLIGNTVAEIINPQELAGLTIVGFENHGGRTRLGSKMKPLAKVLRGGGNNGEDRYEGAVYKQALGSYFHGPLLSKNPHIADWLLERALERKYAHPFTLSALPDELETQAHEFIKQKVL